MVLKKKYFDVTLEVLNSSIPLLGFTPEPFVGRIIKFDLTKILKGKNCEARFLVSMKDNELFGEMISFSMYPSFIRKMIGHNITIIEDSFSCKCQDAKMRVKPFLITRKKVHRSVASSLRNSAKEFLTKDLESMTKERILQAVLIGGLQRELSKKLKKIYPLAVCEIREIKLEK
jgi:ribosomal protein S3AE